MSSNLKKYFKKLDAILVSSVGNIVYLTEYSGFSEIERECFLLLTKGKQYLITDGRYSQTLKKLRNFEVLDIGAHRFISKEAPDFFKKLKIKTIGFEENDLTAAEYLLLKKLARVKPVDLRNLRTVKRDDEIKNIKLACKIGDLTFDFILDKLKLGITEKQVANQIELFIKQKNAEISFRPIVAFGKNSSTPHHLSGNTKLKRNQIVLLDFGVKINNYCSDMTRTVFFGKANNKFKEIYETVLAAQQKAIEYINGQLSMVNCQLLAKDIDKAARDYIASNNYSNIPHSLGHGIGIEVHEAPHLSPNSKDIIKPGMVFSVEPGIYIENYGGVRIEDLVLVTKNGAELISHANRDLIEI